MKAIITTITIHLIMDTMIPITILLAVVELAIVEAVHLIVVEGEAVAVVEVVIDIKFAFNL